VTLELYATADPSCETLRWQLTLPPLSRAALARQPAPGAPIVIRIELDLATIEPDWN
jgi:hypothetical protein